MSSSIGGQTIVISEDSDWQVEATYGEINPIGATSTVLHYAGTPSYKRTISGWILIDGVHDAIKAMAAASSAVNLTTNDDGSQGNVQIMSYSPQKRMACNYAYPIYKYTMQLMQR